MLLHLLTQGSVANDDEASALVLGGDTRRGVEEETMVLDREDAADDSNQWGAIVQAQFSAKASPVRRTVEERFQVEAEGDDADLLCAGHPIVHQVTFDPFTNRNDSVGQRTEPPLHSSEEPGFGG